MHLLTHLRLLLPSFPAGKVERGRVLERREHLLWHHLSSFSELALCPVGAGSWSQWFLWLPIEHRSLRGLWNLPEACLGKAPQSICPACLEKPSYLLGPSVPSSIFLSRPRLIREDSSLELVKSTYIVLIHWGENLRAPGEILAKTVFTSFFNIRETKV